MNCTANASAEIERPGDLDRHAFRWLAASMAAALGILMSQTAPLFWGRSFYLDWINHTWIVQYYADYLGRHLQFPTTLDVIQTFGNPAPLYYGTLLYPVLSVPAVVLGADSAVKVCAALSIVTPAVTVTLLMRHLLKDLPAAILIATVVNSSIYQLTNLYSRSALTEFFALQFLLAGISLTFYGLLNSRRSRISIAAGGAFTTLAFGSHPITVYASGMFVAPLLVVGAIRLRGLFSPENCKRIAWSFGAAIVITFPWIAVVFQYRKSLQITTTNILAGSLHYFPDSIDSLLGRLGYFYFDPRVASGGIDATSTPFLDAPFSLALLLIQLLVLLNISRLNRSNLFLVALPALATSVLLVWCAMPPTSGSEAGLWQGSLKVSGGASLIYDILMPIQFGYRLAGIWTLVLSTSLFIAVASIAPLPAYSRLPVRAMRCILLAAATLSAIASTQKLVTTWMEFRQYPASKGTNSKFVDSDRSILISRQQYRDMIKDTSRYPMTYLSQIDYSSPLGLLRTPPDVKPGLSLIVRHWGNQPPVQLEAASILRTNITPTAMLKILVDGKPADQIALSPSGTADIALQAGDHAISVVKAGPWHSANQISVLLMVIWISFLLFWVAPLPARMLRSSLEPSP